MKVRRTSLVSAVLMAAPLLLTNGTAWAATLSVSSVMTPLVYDNQVRLSWTNTTLSSFAGVYVRRATGTSAPSTRTSGTYVGFVAKPGHAITATGLAPGTYYSFSLWARSASGAYGTRVTRAVRTAPAPIRSLSSSVTDHRVALGWVNPTTATFTGTVIRRALGTTAPATAGSGTSIANVAKPGHGFVDLKVAPGTTYSYALFTHDGVPRYSRRVIKTVTTLKDVTAPATVTGLTPTPGTTQVLLSWVNPTAADFTNVVIRRATGSTPPATATAGDAVATLATPANAFADRGLASGTAYSYSVFARDAGPNYATPAQVTTATTDGTAPNPVESLGGAPESTTSVHLTWTYPADADLATLIVRRAVGGIAPGTTGQGVGLEDVAPGAPGTAGQLTDTGLAQDTTYSYALFSRDQSGNTSLAATVTTATPAPPNAVVSLAGSPVSTTSVRLTWTYPPGQLAQLVVRQAHGTPPATATDGVAAGTVLAGAPGTAGELTVAGLDAGTIYHFAVFSQDQYGQTSAAATTWTATVPAPVENLLASPTSASVELSWDNPAGDAQGSLMIRRSEGSVAPATPADGVVVASYLDPGVPGLSGSLLDSSLSPSTTYTYAVFSYSEYGGWSDAATVTVTTGPPPPPVTGLAATPFSTSVLLTWTDPPGSPLAACVVRRAVGAIAPTSVTDGDGVPCPTPGPAGTSEQLTDSELTPGTTYTYAIFSQDQDGSTSDPATVTVTTTS